MREATRSDLPKGNEAQCVTCWRIFSSDSLCERHKSYRLPKTASCKDPSTLGFEAIERRGVAVWVRSAAEARRLAKSKGFRGKQAT